MKTIEFNIPYFAGFYYSVLDLGEILDGQIGDDENHHLMTEQQYESINWEKTNKEVATNWVEAFNETFKDALNEYGISIKFIEVDSPKYYNYTTDKAVCEATFDKWKLISKLLVDVNNDLEFFENLLIERHKSLSGFISFYDHNVDTWVNEYIKQIADDNVIFETFLMFILGDCTDEILNIEYNATENYFELIHYSL